MASEHERHYYKIAREGGSFDEFPRRNVLDYMRARLKAGDTVLDVGCGTAEILNFLPGGISYLGIEQSEYALLEAREHWTARPGARFEKDGGLLLELPISYFQVALMLFSLEHLKDPRGALLACVRALKPGGFLIIAAPNLEFPLAWPNALRHKSVWFRGWLTLLRVFDYLKRIAGIFSFRIIQENFTEATGRYEKKDDDLRHMVSSWEVIRFLEKNGCVIEKFWEERKLKGWRRIIRLLPAMRWYGVTLAASFRKI